MFHIYLHYYCAGVEVTKGILIVRAGRIMEVVEAGVVVGVVRHNWNTHFRVIFHCAPTLHCMQLLISFHTESWWRGNARGRRPSLVISTMFLGTRFFFFTFA